MPTAQDQLSPPSPRSTADLWQLCAQADGALAKRALRAALEHRAFALSFERGLLVQTLHDDIWRSLEQAIAGDPRTLLDRMGEIGSALANGGAGYAALPEIAARAREPIQAELIERFGSEPRRFIEAVSALQYGLDRALVAISERYVTARQSSARDQQTQAEQALRSSERRFQTLFDSGMIGILICDLAGKILDANDSFLNMVGYTRTELLSGAVSWAEMTPPEWSHLDDAAVEQLKARGVTSTWEKEYFRKDGSRLPILVGVAMLGETDCIAFVLDITERRRLDALRIRSAELESQNRRVQESSRLKNEFLANMSHELRTPLNSIIGFTDMLYDGEVDPASPKHREFLANILKSGRHLLQLINDVLDLAKVEAGKLEFMPEPVDLSQLISEVTAVLRTMAATKQIQIDVAVDPTVKDVCIDPARTKQVLYNYASNALKFTPDGGRVTVRVRPEAAATFRLEVEDTGIGIAAKDISRLFVEFQQLDAGTAKRHAGTGLGLALTKRIVEEQGGSVGLTSTPGAGSVFFAILPRHAEPSSDRDREEVVPQAPQGAATVLVVEDNARDRTLVTQVLSSAGYGVVSALAGGQAIEVCSQRVFDAIILDLLLPDVTGLDVLHRIRSEGMNRSTPVLIVSVVAEQGLVGGFAVHDYLQKPVRGPELLASLRRAQTVAKGGASVLVVDDDADARQLMESMLLNLGLRVHCRADGESALALLALERPDAIILDLMMPGVDGFEFLTRFRQHPENGGIPVIIWTMKELTRDDHRRLYQLAQAVVAKGDTQRESLTRELRLLLQRDAVFVAKQIVT